MTLPESTLTDAHDMGDIRRWLVDRVQSLLPEHRKLLARLWPDGVPTLKASDDHTLEQYQAIDSALAAIEREFVYAFTTLLPKVAPTNQHTVVWHPAMGPQHGGPPVDRGTMTLASVDMAHVAEDPATVELELADGEEDIAYEHDLLDIVWQVSAGRTSDALELEPPEVTRLEAWKVWLDAGTAILNYNSAGRARLVDAGTNIELAPPAEALVTINWRDVAKGMGVTQRDLLAGARQAAAEHGWSVKVAKAADLSNYPDLAAYMLNAWVPEPASAAAPRAPFALVEPAGAEATGEGAGPPSPWPDATDLTAWIGVMDQAIGHLTDGVNLMRKLVEE